MAREVRVAILGDSKDFSRAVSAANRDAGRLEGSFVKVGSGIKSLAKSMAIGVGGIGLASVALGKGFVDAATESLKIGKQTEAVIRSMGGAAGVSAQHVSDFAENWSRFTGIDDEIIQSGENILLTFGNIRNDLDKGIRTFDEASVAALNMSVALGTDVKSAAMQVGKALNDPTKGLAKLARSGVQFTKQQIDQVKWMQAAGDMAGAQGIILAELNRQFGGSAQAQATAGDRLRVVWGNLQEDLGMKLLPVVEKVATWLSDELPPAVDTATRWFGVVSDAVQGLVSVFNEEGAGGIFSRFGALIEQWAPVIGQKLLDLGGKLIDWIGPQIEPMLGKLGEFLGSAVTWLLDTGLPMLAEGAAKLIPALWEWITDPDDGAIVKLLEKLPEFAESFATWVREDMVPSAISGGKDIGSALIEGILEGFGDDFSLPAGAKLHVPGTDINIDLPGKALGGPVRRGQPYVVGERRPELFVPDQNGTILPSVPGSGGGGDFHVHLEGPITQSVLPDVLHGLRKVRLEAAA